MWKFVYRFVRINIVIMANWLFDIVLVRLVCLACLLLSLCQLTARRKRSWPERARTHVALSCEAPSIFGDLKQQFRKRNIRQPRQNSIHAHRTCFCESTQKKKIRIINCILWEIQMKIVRNLLIFLLIYKKKIKA